MALMTRMHRQTHSWMMTFLTRHRCLAGASLSAVGRAASKGLGHTAFCTGQDPRSRPSRIPAIRLARCTEREPIDETLTGEAPFSGSHADICRRHCPSRVHAGVRFGVLASRCECGVDHKRDDPGALGRTQARCCLCGSQDRSGIRRPAGTTQLPPTQRTGFRASQSGAVASVMPPVGQNRTCAERAGQRLQCLDAAGGLGREELEPVEAVVEAAHDVGGIGDARQVGHATARGPPGSVDR